MGEIINAFNNKVMNGNELGHAVFAEEAPYSRNKANRIQLLVV